jgi:hypothetical protein
MDEVKKRSKFYNFYKNFKRRVIQYLKLIIPVRKKFHYIETHLVHHCNLNCFSCSHFSCLSNSKWFADPKKFEKDVKKLMEFKFPIKMFKLLGGEPLLHPKVTEFMRITRKYYANTIEIVTNGILLPKMEEDFWQACHDFDIVIRVTPYPIKINTNKIKSMAKKYDVKIIIGGMARVMRHGHFSSNPIFSSKISFKECRGSFNKTLLEGKLYPCYVVPYLFIFNNKFKTSFPEEKGLNIHKKGLTKKDIIKYLSTPVKMCQYCYTSNIPKVPWKLSEGKLEEWVRTKR